MGENPDWMEQRAKRIEAAGGIEAYKEVKKFIDEIQKVKPDQWKGLNDTLTTIKSFIDLDPTGAFNQMRDSLKESLELQVQQAMAPIINEIYAGITTALEPIMPMITDSINTISTLIGRGFGFIDALISGKLDEFFRDLKLQAQAEGALSWWDTPAQQVTAVANFERLHPDIDLTALSAQGTAGGVYSGQFDLDLDVIDKLLGIKEARDSQRGGR